MLRATSQAAFANAAGSARVLAQGAVPVILPSSGNIANNGALTAITALAATYANCWMSFPAGAIAAGVPAAQTTYYVQMSSTTAGTIFNNILTAGTIPNAASIPASPTAFVTTGPGAYTQSTAIQALITASVPANTLGSSGRLTIRFMESNNNSAGAKTFTIQWGGTTAMSASPTTNQTAVFERIIMAARGLTNVQVSATSGLIGLGNAAQAPNFYAIDTTAAANVVFNGTLATATDTMQYDYTVIEVFPG